MFYPFESRGAVYCDNDDGDDTQVLEDLLTDSNEAAKRGVASDVSVSVGDFFRSRYSTCKAAMIGAEDVKTAMLR